MLFRHNIQHCFEDSIDTHGVSEAAVTAHLFALTKGFSRLKNRAIPGATPLLALPSRTDDIAAIASLAGEIRGRFAQVIVAGAGGSGLSGRMLASIRPGAHPPALHFLETIDPDAIALLLANGDLKDTGFIVISKSGSTAETLAQFFTFYGQAKTALGKDAARHFFIITGEGDSPLRQAAAEAGCTILNHEADIGGRFSVLTNVGLLPAAIAGMDIKKLRHGAQSMIDELDKASTPQDCQAALGAALHAAFMEKQIRTSVLFAYAERLSGLASWWRQSWAESLGKGGKGSTPIRAVGTTDQHSQLQLYLDGPKDKWFHLVTLNRIGTGQRLDVPVNPALDYLQGKTTGDIMAAEQKATFETLVKNRCPVRSFELDALAEEEIGALFMHFTLEIILTAELLGVNPFDQPAVEESKRLTREYLLKGFA